MSVASGRSSQDLHLTPLHALENPIASPDDYSSALDAIQGNILKSHGRNHAAHVVLNFQPGIDPAIVRRRLADVAPTVTSAWRQLQETLADRNSDNLFTGLGIASSGYRLLGKPVDNFPQSFRQGLRYTSDQLGIPSDPWEPHLIDPHCIVILAHRNNGSLQQTESSIRSQFQDIATCTTEWGHVIRDLKTNKPVEHFGFLDGISQPLFYESDLPSLSRPHAWNPAAWPKQVLCPDPLGSSDNDCSSYLVFWKLEEHIAAFREQVDSLAADLQIGADLSRAYLIGRFQDGTPVILTDAAKGETTPANEFLNTIDPSGNRCPFAAHIRKVNPRGTSDGTFDVERFRRIARRAITYGYNPDVEPPRTDGVGILFQCCQRDLQDQFEFLMQSWVENLAFPKEAAGADAILGPQGDRRWPRVWGKPATTDRGIMPFVSSRGGAYFSLPSRTFLLRLRS